METKKFSRFENTTDLYFNMNATIEHVNNIGFMSHLNGIFSLITLMSTHALKTASRHFIQISFDSLTKISYNVERSRGYIIMGKTYTDIYKVLKRKPRLVIAIYETKNLEFLYDLVIPSQTSFFVVQLTKNQTDDVLGRCLMLHRPSFLVPVKIFPLLNYVLHDKPQWIWERNTNWNSYEKETRNMSGVRVLIAVVNNKQFDLEEYWKDKSSFFWKILQEHLGFRIEIYHYRLSPVEIKNVRAFYQGLLTTIADGLGTVSVITSERQGYLDFFVTGLDSKYHLMVKTPEYVHSWHSVFKPFAFESWICLIIAIFLIAIALRIVASNENFSSCCLIVVGFVCSQGYSNITKAWSFRIVCYTALIFSLLIFQFYTSNFYSLLSTKEVKLPFTSMEQFVAKKTHKLYINPHTGIYPYIKNSEYGTFKRLWDEILSKDPFHHMKSDTREQIFKKVCKGTGAIFGLPFQTLFMKELKCKLVAVNSGYFPANTATLTRKHFPFKSQFKFVHLRLLEAGVFHKYRDEFLNIDHQHRAQTDVSNEPVSIEHVAFLFAFQASAIVCSLVILVIEIFISKTIKIM